MKVNHFWSYTLNYLTYMPVLSTVSGIMGKRFTSEIDQRMLELRIQRLLKEKEYAEFANKSLDSVRRDRKQGRGPKHVRINGAIRYKVSDIEDFLQANSK